jgi:glycosyltransferase involved in cell wall biosynthesis
MRTSIIIPTLNHLEDCLKPCINSLLKNTNLEEWDAEVVVVANGCTDGTEDYVRSLGSRFKVISFPNALGYPKAVNAGILASTGEYIVLLNNDLLFLEWCAKNEWLNILESPMREDPKVAITGSSRDMWAKDKWFIVFYCAMIRRSLLAYTGLLDEVFSPGCGEDADLCLKAQQLGYKVVQVPKELPKWETQFPIWHIGHQTINGIPNFDEVGAVNTRILERRYPRTEEDRLAQDAFSGKKLRFLPAVTPFSDEYDINKRGTGEISALETQKGPIRIYQKKWEFEKLLTIYKKLNPRQVLEVGSAEGGSSYWFMQNSEPNTHFISLDILHYNADLMKQWADKRKIQLDCFTMDSHADVTVNRIKAFAPLDFILIDADHSYEASKQDFMKYGPMVRPGGIIVLHDIIETHHQDVYDPVMDIIYRAPMVWKLWKEIKEAGYKTQELYGPDQHDCGIGIVYV